MEFGWVFRWLSVCLKTDQIPPENAISTSVMFTGRGWCLLVTAGDELVAAGDVLVAAGVVLVAAGIILVATGVVSCRSWCLCRG